jgi:hypothetical protein
MLVSRLLVLHREELAGNIAVCPSTSLKYQQLMRIALRFDESWRDGSWFQMVDEVSERLEFLPFAYYPLIYFVPVDQETEHRDQLNAARAELSEVLLSQDTNLEDRWNRFWSEEQREVMDVTDFKLMGFNGFSWNFVQELIEAMTWTQPVLQPLLDPK